MKFICMGIILAGSILVITAAKSEERGKAAWEDQSSLGLSEVDWKAVFTSPDFLTAAVWLIFSAIVLFFALSAYCSVRREIKWKNEDTQDRIFKETLAAHVRERTNT